MIIKYSQSEEMKGLRKSTPYISVSQRGAHAPQEGNLKMNSTRAFKPMATFSHYARQESKELKGRKNFQMEKICYFAVGKMGHIYLNNKKI